MSFEFSPPKNRSLSERITGLIALLFAVFTLASGVLGGGLLVRLLLDWHIENEAPSSEILLLGILSGVALLMALTAGIALFRSRYRRPRWGAVTVLLGIGLAVVAGDLLLRPQMPEWPARALHGVKPAQWAAAVQLESGGEGEKQILNSWGERDRERTRYPQSGTRRIAFIGD